MDRTLKVVIAAAVTIAVGTATYFGYLAQKKKKQSEEEKVEN